MRVTAALVVVLVALSLPAAIVNAQFDRSNTMIGAFDVGPGGGPQIFNPFQATGGHMWLAKYFSRLVVYDVDFTRVYGDLARDWTVSEDGRTWTFYLRDDVKWHDGEPFTADDVRFTLELILTPEFGAIYGSQYTIIEGAEEFQAGEASRVSGIEVVDDYTLRIRTKEAFASFLDTLAWTLFIVPEHKLAGIPPAELMQSDWWRTEPVGTGPFKWSRYVPDQYVELVRNEEYYRGAPKIARLINRYFADDAAAVLALESGDIDFTYINADEVARLANRPNIQVIEGPSQVTNYIALNLRDPRFADVRVRQAIYHAIDRHAIVETLYQGAAEVVHSIFQNPIYLPDDLMEYEYDPEKARRLLAEAGWNSSEPLELLTYYTDPLSQDVLAAIQGYLAEVGIFVEPRVVDVPTYNATFYRGDFTLSYRGLGSGPDPDTVRPTYHSAMVHPQGLNGPGYNSPAVDEGLDMGRTTFDQEKRRRWYQQVARAQNHEALDIYMWASTRYAALNKRIANFVWTPAPAGSRYDDEAEKWEIVGGL